MRSTLLEDFAFAGPKGQISLLNAKKYFVVFSPFAESKPSFRRVTEKHVPIEYLSSCWKYLEKSKNRLNCWCPKFFFCDERIYVRHKLSLFRFDAFRIEFLREIESRNRLVWMIDSKIVESFGSKNFDDELRILESNTSFHEEHGPFSGVLSVFVRSLNK